MNKEKLLELRARMLNHSVKDDVAVVEVTAAELEELIKAAEFVEEVKNLIPKAWSK